MKIREMVREMPTVNVPRNQRRLGDICFSILHGAFRFCDAMDSRGTAASLVFSKSAAKSSYNLMGTVCLASTSTIF